MTSVAEMTDRKGEDIARCLGYHHALLTKDNGDLNRDTASAIDESKEPGEDSASSPLGEIRTEKNDARDVDMWHLRSLAIQPGGLLNSHGRKLGWIKLAGIDNLVFQGNHTDSGSKVAPPLDGDDDSITTYEEIQKHLEEEMEPSRWHIQRERRRLKKKMKNQDKKTAYLSSSALSHASSTNDVSSAGSESGSSTPLTANLGTPKSVTFQGLEPSTAGAPFTAFSSKRCTDDLSATTTCASFPSISVDTTFHSIDSNGTMHTPSSNNGTTAPSPLSLSSPSPTALPQCQFQWSLAPKSFQDHSRKYQKKHKLIKSKPKKDRRPKERNVLVQIASSAFLLRSRQLQDSDYKLQYYAGMQDLIAVLLLHLESPSLTSLLLKQIMESHLWMYCTAYEEEEEEESDAAFKNCIIDADNDEYGHSDSESVCTEKWDVRSLAFFPLLQVLDEEMHSSLLQIEEGQDFLTDRAFEFGEVLNKWLSTWFCCHDNLPLKTISRVVDFFLASHPSMPLYLSMAILCHPIQRNRFLHLSQQPPKLVSDPESNLQPPQSPPRDYLPTVLENVFLNLPQQLSSQHDCDEDDTDGFGADHGDNDEQIDEFMEQAISMAISFMKQVSPQAMFSLVKEYRNGILMPHLNPQEHERTTPFLWTKRSSAPRDYSMIQRWFADEKRSETKRFALLKSVTARHQMALDASGLPMSQLMTQPHWSTSVVTPIKVIAFGITLFVVAQLMQANHNPWDIRITGFYSGNNSGLHPLLVPLQVSKPTKTTLTPILSHNDTETQLVISKPSLQESSEQLVEDELKTEAELNSEPKRYVGFLYSALKDNRAALSNASPDTGSGIDLILETPPVTAEDDAGYLGGVIDALSNLCTFNTTVETDVSDAIADPEIETMLSLPGQSQSSDASSDIDKNKHHLDHGKTAESMQPAVSADHATKRNKAKKDKFMTRIKTRASKSLVGFKNNCKSLVENDDFFL